ncbi:MBL fold metallo-hydrolase [Qipengyuania sp. ASV99]|uniref:MBL fold metallo-hydrolase n=1 Tax=Qipengyuania sp. ASV99 TaxID=3399681 RepID=UPI003A4C7FCC
MRFMMTGLFAASLSGCGSFVDTDQNALAQSSAAACPTQGAALQVLGSGGPIAEKAGEEGRAGTSYLLWIDGAPRLLIDAGAGSFLRFAEAGGNIAALDAILLSHLHADHVGDLAGILNSGGFEGRTAPLTVIGPDAAPRFPGTREFLTRLLSKDSGAFAYNGGFIDGTEGKPRLEPLDIVTAQGDGAAAVLDISSEYRVTAHPVNHGVVPALGYVIELGNASVVITGDQSAASTRFMDDLTGAKPAILFAHHVINAEAGQPRGLHRTPAEIGALAAALEPQQLVLTHNMERSLSRIEGSLSAIGAAYSGPVSVASDLDCYAL